MIKRLFYTCIFFAYSYASLSACDALFCKTMVNLSIGPTCNILITADLLLEAPCPDGIFVVDLYDADENPLPNPIDGSYLGVPITAVVKELVNGIACESEFILEDKTPPFIDFVGAPITLSCQDDLEEVISIGTFDNCGLSNAKLIDTRYVCSPCEYDSVYLTWELIDEYGNAAEETKGFEFVDFCMDVTFPPDVSFDCSPDPEDIPSTVIVSDGDIGCPLVVDINYSDIRIGCDITRFWTITEGCSGRTITHSQFIEVNDDTPPDLEVPPFTATITLDEYNAGFRPPFTATDDCPLFYTVIDNTLKEVISCDPVHFIAKYGIQSTDLCGNSSPQEEVYVHVQAEDPPKLKIKGTKNCLRPFIVSYEYDNLVEPVTVTWNSTNPSWELTLFVGTQQASLRPAFGNTYVEVTITDALGCTITKRKKYKCNGKYLGWRSNEESYQVYPNPINDQLYLELSEEINRVTIHGLDGKTMFSQIVNTTSLQMNTSDWPVGLYLLQLSSDENVWTEKIMKE